MVEWEKRFDEIATNILGELRHDMDSIDSILYIEFLMAVEREFEVKFNAQEFATLRTLERIKEKVSEKLASKRTSE